MSGLQPLRYRAWWIAGGVLIAVGITAGSLTPIRSLPAFDLWDKAEHSAAYAVLAAWFAGVVAPSRYLRLAAALLGFGIAIEIAQQSMGIGRTADPGDVLANGIGIAIGLGVAALGASSWMLAIERLAGAGSPPAG